MCPLRLYPATPGWGVWCGCVCLGSGFACAPPLLAGCWGVCLLVCAPRLYPAIPGGGVRCGCVCLGPGFACAPPLLAGVLGCVCVCVRTPLVPRHSWLGCAVWVCVLRLEFRLRPATPGSGVGMFVCLLARSACTPPLLAGMCGVGVYVWAQVSAAPLHSWLGRLGVGVCVRARVVAAPRLSWLGCWGVPVCVRALLVPCPSWLGCAVWACVFGLGLWLRPAFPGWGVGVCVFVCALPWYPATPGWRVRCRCVCLGSGFGCAPPLLAGVLGCVCVCVRALLVPRHSWLGCASWVCALELRFPLRPATPGWGVGVSVCLLAHSACTLPLLAWVCGVGVCVWARISAVPRHFWLGCWGVCVFVCALPLYAATPGWGLRRGCVRLGSGFGCALPPLAGVLGRVCACVCTPLVPRHSWLGCAVWVCVLGLGIRMRLGTPGSGVRVCLCLLARSACTPPLLAGVCGVGVCVWARVSAAPGLSWLGRWVCVCLCVRFVCIPPLLAWVCGVGVCAWARGFFCAPPLLAGVLGCVCVCLCAPVVPRHSWLGCAAWVCVLALGFRLRPATLGGGVGVCVPLCAHSACTPPFLAWVCGVWVWCCLAPVSVPWFLVCCVRCPGLRHAMAVVAWHLSVCLGLGRRRASLACPLAPRGAQRLVRSGRSLCSGQLS